MKKLLSKKANVFGKKVPVFVIALIAVLGVASAALVPYLSGLVTGNTTVNSPVLLQGAEGDSELTEDWDGTEQIPADSSFSTTSTLFMSSTHSGGESDSFWVKATNNADARVDSYLVFEVTNDEGLTSTDGEIDDFADSTITIYDWVEGSTTKRSYTVPINDLILYQESSNTWRIYAPLYLFETDDDRKVIYADIELNFPLNAIGTYTVKGAVLTDPTTGAFPTA